MQIGKIARVTALLVLISGCSSYSSNFSCGDSRGANCMPMDKVDLLISSGEIEVYTLGNGKCRGKHCHDSIKDEELKELKAPSLQGNKIYFKEQK